jgi:hypothetical protein
MPDLKFVSRMDPQLARYLDYAFMKTLRHDFLRAMEPFDTASLATDKYPSPHHVWETALWLNASHRILVKRSDGSCKIITAKEKVSSDKVMPNALKPCRVTVRQDGRFIYEFVRASNLYMYDREDAQANQTALQQALPDLYISFKTNAK